MTLCTGALCNGGKNIVLTGDRRLYMQSSELAFNLLQPKIVTVGAFGLSFAGKEYPELAAGILRETEENKPKDFDDFSRIVKSAYYRLRKQKISEHLLDITPPGLIEDFVDGEDVYSNAELQQLSKEYTLGTHFMIAGFDSGGIGHLTQGWGFTPTKESPFDSFDSPGWVCIGVSAIAEHYLANKINPSTSLAKIVYTLFSAHQLCSDTIDCISREVDIVVLGRTGSCWLNDEKISQLEVIYKEEKRENARSLEEALKKVGDIELPA